jgi:hypothetical protein
MILFKSPPHCKIETCLFGSFIVTKLTKEFTTFGFSNFFCSPQFCDVAHCEFYKSFFWENNCQKLQYFEREKKATCGHI